MASAPQDSMDKAAQPTLCTNGCGFYSNAGTGGLCSKCHREQQLQAGALSSTAKQIPAAPPAPIVDAVAQPSSASTASTSAPAAAAPPAAALAAVEVPAPSPSTSTPSGVAPAQPQKPSPTRCLTCNKKVGLTGFNCKCQPDAVFCSTHRYAEAHNCAFDWRATQRAALAANNPVVQASKLQKL